MVGDGLSIECITRMLHEREESLVSNYGAQAAGTMLGRTETSKELSRLYGFARLARLGPYRRWDSEGFSQRVSREFSFTLSRPRQFFSHWHVANKVAAANALGLSPSIFLRNNELYQTLRPTINNLRSPNYIVSWRGWSESLIIFINLSLLIILLVCASIYEHKTKHWHGPLLKRIVISIFFAMLLTASQLVIMDYPPPYRDIELTSLLAYLAVFTGIFCILLTTIFEWKPWRKRSKLFRMFCFFSGCWIILVPLLNFLGVSHFRRRWPFGDEELAMMFAPVIFVGVALYIYKKYIDNPVPKGRCDVQGTQKTLTPHVDGTSDFMSEEVISSNPTPYQAVANSTENKNNALTTENREEIIVDAQDNFGTKKKKQLKQPWNTVICAISILLLLSGFSAFNYAENIMWGATEAFERGLRTGLSVYEAMRPLSPREWDIAYERARASGLSQDEARRAAGAAVRPIMSQVENWRVIGSYLARAGFLGIIYLTIHGIYYKFFLKSTLLICFVTLVLFFISNQRTVSTPIRTSSAGEELAVMVGFFISRLWRCLFW